MKKFYSLILVFVISLFVVGCGDNAGGGFSNTTQQFTLTGYVKDEPVQNAEVAIYNSESQKLGSTLSTSDGKYILSLSIFNKDEILKNGFAYIEAEKNDKKLRGLILGINSLDNEYEGEDTYISHYTEAIFRIKDVLGLDLVSTKILYEDFLQSYEDGTYKLNDNSYSFAFRELIEELALDVKDYFYNDKPLLSNSEIIDKIKKLNQLEIADFRKAQKYSFPLLNTDNNSTTLQIISFTDFNSTNDFTVNMNKIVKTDSPFYDKATITKFDFSDTNAVLRNVTIKTFDMNKSSSVVVFNEEYKDELKHNQSSQVIKNNKLKLVLNNETEQGNSKLSKTYEKVPVQGDSTDIYYKDGKAIVQLKFDTSKLGFIATHVNQYDLYVNVEVYDDKYDWYNPFTYYDPDNNSPVIDLEKGTDIYEYDFTKLINRYDGEDKHLPVRVTLLENDFITTDKDFDEKIPLAKCYGFIDWNNDYSDATLATLTMKETLRGITTAYGDNVFKNDKGHELEHVNTLPTHRIIDFDKIVAKDFITKEHTNKPWKDTKYAKEYRLKFVSEDNRIPLLLIHGWQGDKGMTFPSKLLRYENSEFEYWHNFISYYLATPEIHKKYKLYTYHYPSYKHVTYNGRMLKELLINRINKNSVLGKGVTDNGMVIIGHSMGGLVARSMIEEHEGLGKNAEKLIKLITLDTPHHGAIGPISNFWRTEIASVLVKDLDTPGAIDLLWDNYDNKYDKDNNHFKATIKRNNGDSRYKRLDELENYKGLFDYFYKNKKTLNSVISSPNADISHWMNPYLDNLNDNLNEKDRIKTFAKEKYVIYTAMNIRENENFVVGGVLDSIHSEGSDSLYNPIRSNDQMSASTDLINDEGYAGGGAEPVCSSLLSFQKTPDNITRFSPSINYEVENIIPKSKKYIDINNFGNEHNNYIPYRIFWDYDHETIMNGSYIKKGLWDIYIDEKLLGNKNLDNKTCFSDIKDGLGEATMRGVYIDFAFDYLYYEKTNRELTENTPAYQSYANPLRMEPVFLVLQKDLLDALSLDNSIIDFHPLQGSTDFDIDDNITLTFHYPFDSSSVNKVITLENLDTSTEVTTNIDFDSEGKILKINPDNNLTYAHKYKLTYSIDGNLKDGKTSSINGELIFTTVDEKAPNNVPLIGITPDGNFNYNGGKFKLIVSPLDNNQELITDSLAKNNFSFSDIRVTSKDNEDDIKSFGEANVTSIDVTTYDKSNNVALIIVLDSSGSMSGNDPQRQRVEASKKLIDLMGETDTIAVIDFGAGTTSGKRVSRVLSDFTNDKTQLKDAIDNAVASGGTPLYESILDAEDMLSSYPNKTKVIVVLTDGEANSNTNLDLSIQKAKDNGILIFPIGLGNNLDFNELERLASETDGVFGRAVDANSLEEVYSSIGVGALKGKVSVFGKGSFKSPLTSEGEYRVFGKLKTDINKKSLETPFSFIINVEEQ